MIEVGQAAPNIRLKTDTGEDFDLSAHRGRKIVLYFYPRADTPGCTVEACEFRDNREIASKALVVGISPDTPAAQAKFKSKFDLNFTLLADADKKVATDYGLLKEKNMYGKKVMGVERTTYIIDEQGKIAHIFPKVKPEGHAAEVLAAL